MTFDIILKGGLIYDGKGNPPFPADIGIKDHHIAKIAPALSETAAHIEDCSHHWICPGFIDIHTHYDAEVELNPGLSESVRHGVTSVVMGNCSLSLNIGEPKVNANLFERVETIPELIKIWQQQAKKWPTTSSYLEHLNTLPLGPNVACMVGHSAIRAEIMGLKRSLTEKATPEEITKMASLAKEALIAGCIGISIDMVHWHRTTGAYPGKSLPSHHADYREYAALAKICREHNAVFQLTPNPKNMMRSILNILKLTHGITRAPLRCTILSAMDMEIQPQSWRLATLFATLCNKLLDANIRFQTIPEPFTIYSDGPITPLFEEFEAGYLLNNLSTTKERQALWRQPHFKEKFSKDWQNFRGRTFKGDLSKITIVDAPVKSWCHQTVANIAERNQSSPLAFWISVLEQYDTALRWKHTGANHRAAIRYRLMQHPFVLPGFSDAGAHCRNMGYFDSALSFIRQCTQDQFMPIEQAIKRVTFEPAQWFNIDGGALTIGAKADILVLDPEALKHPGVSPCLAHDPSLQNATRMIKRDPYPPVVSSFINGEKVISNGEPLAALGRNKTGILFSNTQPIMSLKARHKQHRNRIDSHTTQHSLSNYWDIFLLKHQKKYNIRLHYWAFILMYAIPLIAIGLEQYALILLMPLSQITGLIGHHYFERSTIDQRDTVFSWRAFISLHKLFYYVSTKQYAHEIRRVKKQIKQVI